MRRLLRVIPKYIAPPEVLLPICIIFTLVLLVQVFFHGTLLDNTPVWEGECTFKEWSNMGDLKMLLDCSERGDRVLTDITDIRDYLLNPGPMTCTISAADTMNCDPPVPSEEG